LPSDSLVVRIDPDGSRLIIEKERRAASGSKKKAR
jgi:hypothetical protein